MKQDLFELQPAKNADYLDGSNLVDIMNIINE